MPTCQQPKDPNCSDDANRFHAAELQNGQIKEIVGLAGDPTMVATGVPQQVVYVGIGSTTDPTRTTSPASDMIASYSFDGGRTFTRTFLLTDTSITNCSDAGGLPSDQSGHLDASVAVADKVSNKVWVWWERLNGTRGTWISSI